MKASITTRTTAALIIAAAVTTGCTTINPYTGEQQTSKAVKGAAIGAGVGAVVGIISGDNSRERRKRALIGAGVGAVAGGSVGVYMDVQEAKLREQLQGTGVSVTREGDNVILNMPGNVTFATNSADLNANFFSVLDSVVLVLNEYDKTLIEIVGHTDSTGAADFNQRLSERRAQSVATYLQSRELKTERMSILGMGKNQPIADNSMPEGRQQNRRVELTLIPLTTS